MLIDLKLELTGMISAAEYTLWIENLEAVAITPGDQFIILCPSHHARMVIEEKYLFAFFEAACALKQPNMSFLLIRPEELPQFADVMTPKKNYIPPDNGKPSAFMKNFVFDNFVVGESNRLAYMTARAVAETPGVNDGLLNLNPFYIYGGVGLGKTHLLHSIGNYLEQNSPELKVLYTTAENLKNEYFSSLSTYSSNKDAYRIFREKYASLDVLMLDDVQFLIKQGGVQDIFFHIFSDLHTKGKQIILSSDRPPKEINDIADRLRSRFEGGIMCDIWAPSLDMRVEILTKKLDKINRSLDPAVINYLAENVTSNVRELEGAFSKILMYAQLEKKSPSIEKVKELLKIGKDEDDLDAEKIIQAVSKHFNITRQEIVGKSKLKEIAEARMIAVYLVCELLQLPLINIGQIFGGRDHSTIIHSRDKITNQLSDGNARIKKLINDIREALIPKG